jgi:hypothetical protein
MRRWHFSYALDTMIELSEGTVSAATREMLHHAISEHPCPNASGVVRTMRRMVENIRRWFAGIGAAFRNPTEYFSRPRRAASDIATETGRENAPEEAGADAAATESAVETPTTTATFTTPVTADGKIGQDVQVSCVVPIRQDQQEIQRRLELVRAMFNDFWSGCDDKPAAFVDRLDQAEPYLNERLTACGEFWQLDANTRKMLSLPPRSNSRREENGAVRR